MQTKETEQTSAAEQNGRAWLDTITAACEAYGFCAEEGEGKHLSLEAKAVLREHGYDGTNHNVAGERIEDAMREAPLSLEVRSGWHTPGEDVGPEEFQVLLSTGGPALRMMGELNHGEPARCWLEIQDWGTPWLPCHAKHAREVDALLWFAGLFYYGEG
jgi:hypothetical protein